MTYPHSFGNDPFYRPDPPIHPPTFLPSFHDYSQLIISSFTSYYFVPSLS